MSVRTTTIAATALLLANASLLAADAQAEDDVVLDCKVVYELQAHPTDEGYDHVVAFDSSCEHRLACTVTNDEGHEAEIAVPPEGKAAVTIDEDEAGTSFEAKARCQPVAEA